MAAAAVAVVRWERRYPSPMPPPRSTLGISSSRDRAAGEEEEGGEEEEE
jgi:hypothetical protein